MRNLKHIRILIQNRDTHPEAKLKIEYFVQNETFYDGNF